jgi:hypothetical protein
MQKAWCLKYGAWQALRLSQEMTCASRPKLRRALIDTVSAAWPLPAWRPSLRFLVFSLIFLATLARRRGVRRAPTRPRSANYTTKTPPRHQQDAEDGAPDGLLVAGPEQMQRR